MKYTPKTPKTPNKKQGKWIRSKYPSRPEVFEDFSRWMAYPKSIRKPKNQGEFAIQHEVSPDTLSDYKKKNEFWEKVEQNKERLKWEIESSIQLDKAFKEIEEKENNQIEENTDNEIISRMKKYL